MSAKLLVVAGPNRGATYFLQDGLNNFGRSPENSVVLASTQVSKRHCSMVLKDNKVELRDEGSANGTFVNGVLAKKKLLKSRDRISIGPFVLELVVAGAAVPKVAADAGIPGMPPPGDIAAPQIDAGMFKMEEEPKGIVAKYRKKFDDIFLPVVWDFYERKDFSTLLGGLFAGYVLINLGFTVYPVLQSSREEVLRQTEQQALYISKQVAYLNRQAILEGKEGALQTDFAESELYVKEVVVTSLEGRIMAPGSRLNESYTNAHFLRYRDRLQKNQAMWEKPIYQRLPDEDEVIAFTPVMVMSKTKGINVPGAISVVVFSTASVALDSGTIANIYLQALAWSFLLGVVFLYLVFQLANKPIIRLADDVDKFLRGEYATIEKKYQNEYMDQLIDTINSALSRIPKAGSIGEDTGAKAGDTEQVIIDNLMRSIEFMATQTKHSMLLLDTEMRIKLTNPGFEELTGIRGGVGELIDSVSRDESFPALVKEMAEKAVASGSEGHHEDYDFNSGLHKIHSFALTGLPGKTEAFLILFEKMGD